MSEDYFRQIATLIATASIVHSSSITYDKRSTSIGFIRGDISLALPHVLGDLLP